MTGTFDAMRTGRGGEPERVSVEEWISQDGTA